MNSELRIPTLLGLSVLVAGLILGVFLTSQSQILKSKATTSFIPQNVSLTNISDNQATISWSLSEETTGFVQAGTTPYLGLIFLDERDQAKPKAHLLHYVTLTNLTANTTYYYKINSGSISYPEKPLTFKTSSPLSLSNSSSLIGTISDSNLRPVPEAIVFLQLPGAQMISALTKIAGNFILPLSSLRTDSLANLFPLNEASVPAKLTVTTSQQSSKITLFLPPLSPILPPITLGKDLDLTNPASSSSPALFLSDQTTYDLNQDRMINALDLAIIFKNWGKHPQQKEADLNHDGAVDEKDVTVFNNFLSKIAPTLFSLPKK